MPMSYGKVKQDRDRKSLTKKKKKLIRFKMFYSGYYRMTKLLVQWWGKIRRACGYCLSFLDDMQRPICVKKTVNFLSR